MRSGRRSPRSNRRYRVPAFKRSGPSSAWGRGLGEGEALQPAHTSQQCDAPPPQPSPLPQGELGGEGARTRSRACQRAFGSLMLTRRIIPCLDVRDGQVVKGVRFRDHVVMGGIEDLAARYRDAGADELVFYDITASPQGRGVDRRWVERVARIIDIPFCVAGGIRSVDDARAVLHAGADKISVNSPALERPQLVDELAAAFGVQCVVVGIDSLRDADGEWRVRQYSGDPNRTQALPRRTLDWVDEAQRRGAGEIVLNC